MARRRGTLGHRCINAFYLMSQQSLLGSQKRTKLPPKTYFLFHMRKVSMRYTPTQTPARAPTTSLGDDRNPSYTDQMTVLVKSHRGSLPSGGSCNCCHGWFGGGASAESETLGPSADTRQPFQSAHILGFCQLNCVIWDCVHLLCFYVVLNLGDPKFTFYC